MNQFTQITNQIALLEKTTHIPLQEGEVLSKNTKTGWSLNFPVVKTCSPTLTCRRICYGTVLGRPITWRQSLIKQLKLLRYFREYPTKTVGDRILERCRGSQLEWLRWNGVGDLFPEAVRVINYILQAAPDLTVFVVTRKPTLAMKIKPTQNLYLGFSLDKNSDHKVRTLAHYSQHPRMFFTYLREMPDEDTSQAQLIFNAQHKKEVLPHSSQCCPVDSGRMDIHDACNVCRKCFSRSILQGVKWPGQKQKQTFLSL